MGIRITPADYERLKALVNNTDDTSEVELRFIRSIDKSGFDRVVAYLLATYQNYTQLDDPKPQNPS